MTILTLIQSISIERNQNVVNKFKSIDFLSDILKLSEFNQNTQLLQPADKITLFRWKLRRAVGTVGERDGYI